MITQGESKDFGKKAAKFTRTKKPGAPHTRTWRWGKIHGKVDKGRGSNKVNARIHTQHGLASALVDCNDPALPLTASTKKLTQQTERTEEHKRLGGGDMEIGKAVLPLRCRPMHIQDGLAFRVEANLSPHDEHEKTTTKEK